MLAIYYIYGIMPLRTPGFIQSVIEAIRDFQSEELMSDRELSLAAGLSPTMVSKIKSWKTIPKLSTVRKLRDLWVKIKKPPVVEDAVENDEAVQVDDWNNVTIHSSTN